MAPDVTKLACDGFFARQPILASRPASGYVSGLGMDSVKTLIIGAGVSGLATAASLRDKDLCVLERDAEIGGYCKTVRREGFTWDYSGHFFHFRHPEIEQWLRERMGGQQIRKVQRRSFVRYGDQLVDFPFQKNIHQLPKDELVDCLHDLFFARLAGSGLPGAPPAPAPERNFKEMLYGRYGRAIAEKFLIPYNEKLYACDLATLDREAMGRFFPHADLVEIVRNMKQAQNEGYNATFTYPEGGAIEYIRALASEVPADRIALEEPLVAIDLPGHVARTAKREIRYRQLVSSAPFPQLVRVAGLAHDPSVFSWNQVLVFNLGFDKKGPRQPHWIYFPDKSLVFYRVGFYDNIFDSDRMSLYVELGFPANAQVHVETARHRVLEDLRKAGVVTDHRLIAEHHVQMDPAYVHITQASLAEHARLAKELARHDVHAIGRYGGWTYCSIEDNIVEARALADQLERA